MRARIFRRPLVLLLGGALALLLAVGEVSAVPPGATAQDASAAPAGAAAPAQARASVPRLHRPAVSGGRRVGEVLRVKVRVDGPGKPKLSYTWLRDGTRISGATKRSYTLRSADRRHRVSVRVTAEFTGSRTVRARSASTPRIRARAIDDPASIQVVVNKKRPLRPKSYVPADLIQVPGVANPGGQPVRRAAARALSSMAAGARRSGLDFSIISGYRSYGLQRSLYNSYVARDGRARADTYSARPGHSEHQTGLAVDLGTSAGCGLSSCFGETAVGRWLAANSHRYGFILRYPRGYTRTTGYTYEPWHFRYVGTRIAKRMKQQKIRTLERYMGLRGAPDYR